MKFSKLSGAGNDFILVDGTRRKNTAWPALARALCPRRSAVGADGLLVVKKARVAKVLYYNADGSRAFCGNGMRCAAWWLHHAGWAGRTLTMDTNAGILEAHILSAGRASVAMPAIKAIAGNRVDTGVPHAVVRVSPDALRRLNPVALGRPLRRKYDANVDFTAIDKKGRVFVRTYERGVEDETLACGTGVVAAAWFAARWSRRKGPVTVRARGGILRARFDADGKNVFLEGPVKKIYEGETTL